MNKVIVGFVLGLALGLLIASLVLASEEDQSHKDKEWCLYYQFDSMDHYEATVPPASTVFIKFNGKKVQVHTKCSDSPTPPPPVSQ